jgi:hypothetical protein
MAHNRLEGNEIGAIICQNLRQPLILVSGARLRVQQKSSMCRCNYNGVHCRQKVGYGNANTLKLQLILNQNCVSGKHGWFQQLRPER